MRNAALFLLIILSYKSLEAQQVAGFVRDDKGKPLAGASIALKKERDSSIVKIGISNSSGEYEFAPVEPGRYFIAISHTGYAPQNSASFETIPNGSAQAPAIALSRATTALREAVVLGRKPLIEVRPDKMIFNVEGSINEIGSDALELLRKSPGITVDKDNNLSLNGKNGVQVYVDGRPTYLSGANLGDYLKTLQSSSIATIEIISNPSAKYEAAGNAGIINIRLKKNQAYGTNMTVSAGYKIGTYGKYNGSLSFNHRDRNINIFGDYAYNHAQNETYATMYRTQLDTFFLQRSTLVSMNNTHTYKVGLDYFISSRSTLGLVVNGSSQDEQIRSNSATPIIYMPTNKTDRILQANNRTDGSRDNVNGNANYRYVDTSGRELDIDADYGLYHLRSNQYQPNNYFDSTGKAMLYSRDYTIVSPTDIHIYTFKADYETNLAKGKLGFGGKTSYVTTGNDFQEYGVYSYPLRAPLRLLVKPTVDTLSRDNFDYRENINALYANYKRTLKGWIIQGGLRVENTNAKGTSTGYQANSSPAVPYDSSFTRHYTDLFPSASVSYNKNPMKQWTLSYSRRIDRPAYQDLNPFEFKLDDYTFAKGNTLLRPQYTNSVGLTFMYKYKLTTTLNYSHIKDLSTTLVDTTDASKAIVLRENLANQDIVSLNISYPFQYRWYSVFFNVSSFYQLNRANLGQGRVIDLNIFNTTIFSQHTIRMGKGWTGEITQYYVSPNIWQATLRAQSMWSIDGGLQKTLFKGNGTFKVAVSDIFNTLHWKATSNFAGQYILTTGGYESRLLKLYFTYRLGNKQVKAARRHSNGAEEENKRVGAGSGGATP
ncbi:TonB-dependent receptor [Puia dinghuensis]|uniref:TonB-dependent receptor n=1 Tax=Puia dinghuensis TaxID=1792502 RepID=A0A8J2XU61_9BACT|nr:TonB-dependent receptor [Puia dinghuensis]GGB09074.1 TonB-dependent receptor [Puia dinghuensis]